MQNEEIIQLSKLFNSSRPNAVLNEIYRIFTFYYPPKSFKLIKKCYIIVSKLFDGTISGYKKCNTFYHDFGHVLNTLLATVRLLDGNNLTKRKLTPDLVVNMILAAIFHDTGYIQEISDNNGTGGKYTKNHIERSIDFIKKNNVEIMLKPEEIELISKLIRFTDQGDNANDIGTLKEDERKAGHILGTAEIIGQMADRHYLEKLFFLYEEFKEGGINGYNSEYDIFKNTLDFYDKTKDRLSTRFMNTYDLTRFHFRQRYQIDRDLYMETIERNMDYLKQIVDDKTSDIRNRLKRENFTKLSDKSSASDEPASSETKIPV
jgi:hypothetical protein